MTTFAELGLSGPILDALKHLGYEQPTLSRQFGASYEAYRRAVPAWWPRWRPWRPDHDE